MLLYYYFEKFFGFVRFFLYINKVLFMWVCELFFFVEGRVIIIVIGGGFKWLDCLVLELFIIVKVLIIFLVLFSCFLVFLILDFSDFFLDFFKFLILSRMMFFLWWKMMKLFFFVLFILFDLGMEFLFLYLVFYLVIFVRLNLWMINMFRFFVWLFFCRWL